MRPHLLQGETLVGNGFQNGWYGAAAEQQPGRVMFGVAADLGDAQPAGGQGGGEIGGDGGFADAPFTVQSDAQWTAV